MRKIIVLCAVLLCFAGAVAAQDNTTATVTADPQATGASHTSSDSGYPWQVGTNFTYQRIDIGNSNTNLYGIHTTVIQPWAHLLAGGAHDRFNQGVGPSAFNTFGIMGGGGVDFQWRSHVAWRVQVDYLGTRFGSVWQKSVTTGVGILFDF